MQLHSGLRHDGRIPRKATPSEIAEGEIASAEP